MKKKDDYNLIWEAYVAESRISRVDPELRGTVNSDGISTDDEHVYHASEEEYDDKADSNYLRDVLGYEPEDMVEDDPDQSAMDRKAREIYEIGIEDKKNGEPQKPALTAFGSYSDYYTRGYYNMPFEAEVKSKEERDRDFSNAYGKDIEAHYARKSRSGR